MARAWCLPPQFANAFVKALRDGELAPDKLIAMSSAERREAFAKYVGEENAHEVNAQFESKLLLQDQKRGLVSWAKKVSGISEPARRDILTQIEKMDCVLQPEDEQSFLEDLAAKKLGISVTAEEARNIFDMSQRAERIRQEIVAQGEGDYNKGWTAQSGTDYGNARLALLDYMNSLKPGHTTFAKGMFVVLNLPREALTSILHWSAPFVQLWGSIGTKAWWSGLGKMFQYFASEAEYQNMEGYIIGHPDYPLAVDGKLGLTKISDKLTAGEEGLQAHLLGDGAQWLSDRTGVPNLIRGWQRSFVGVINYVRFRRFTEMLDAARLNGEDVSAGSKVVSDMAKVVNNFTGRGTEIDLGVHTITVSPGAATAMNALFFAPRKFIATVEMFNPITYAKLSPTARLEAVKQLSGALIATGSILTLAKFAGADVNLDPRSSDFLKINVGGEKFDVTGGNASYTRLWARMVSGQSVTSSGKVLDLDSGNQHGLTRAEVLSNYARGKLAPVAAFIADALYGKDPTGQAFSVTNEVRSKLIPIAINDWIEMLQNNPGDTAAFLPALTALLGVGMESPLPPMSQSGRDVWGDKMPGLGGPPKDWATDPVNQETKRLNFVPSMPSMAIRGQKLTADQYDQFAQLSGKLAHTRLEQMVASPGWEQIPAGIRVKAMKGAISTSRRIAETTIMMQSQGSVNDILAKANAAKMATLGVTP